MTEHSRTHLKYTGRRDPKTRKCQITVEDLNTGSQWRLDPRRDLFNHSPDGFEWGYGGSGPAQTALAILVAHLADESHHPTVLAALGMSLVPTEDDRTGLNGKVRELHEFLAIRYHQTFKALVVSKLPEWGWELTDEQIEQLMIEKPASHASA